MELEHRILEEREIEIHQLRDKQDQTPRHETAQQRYDRNTRFLRTPQTPIEWAAVGAAAGAAFGYISSDSALVAGSTALAASAATMVIAQECRGRREEKEFARDMINTVDNPIPFNLCIRNELITDRTQNDKKWEREIKRYRERLVRQRMNLGALIVSRLTEIGQRYSTSQEKLEKVRRSISEHAYKDQELTLRANFHADRWLALKEIEKKSPNY